MRIRCHVADAGPCAYYRMELPARELQRLGHEVELTNLLQSSAEGGLPKDWHAWDVWVFQRVGHPHVARVMRALAAAGKAVVHENDDDFIHLPRTNPSFDAWGSLTQVAYTVLGRAGRERWAEDLGRRAGVAPQTPMPDALKKLSGFVGDAITAFLRDGDLTMPQALVMRALAPLAIAHLGSHKAAYRASTLATCSTPELAESYAPFCEQRQVVLNAIDPDLFDAWREPRDTVNLGWIGSSTHAYDLLLLRGIVEEAFRRWPQVRLHFGGQIGPADQKDSFLWRHAEGKPIHYYEKDLVAWLHTLPADRVVYHPYVKHTEVASVIRSFDVGLCPLEDHTFNASKSELKSVEYGAMGVPAVMSDVAPYRRWVGDRNGEWGFVCTSAQEWLNAIRTLVEDPDRRMRMGRLAREKVLAEYTIGGRARSWEAAMVRAVELAGREPVPA